MISTGKTREELIQELKQHYIPARVDRVEPEFIDYEEQMADLEDLEQLLALMEYHGPVDNPHNSVLLYIMGSADQYDFTKYVDTIGGSYADIDMDIETQKYQTVIDWLIEHYGRHQVSSIGTLVKFKPRGVTQKFFAATMPRSSEPDYEKKLAAHFQTQKEILECIPEALFGKEPTLQECVEGNPKKGFKPHPELVTNPKYRAWYEMAKSLEDMVATTSIHAAGVVIADFPISDVCPQSYKQEKDEYTKQDTERWITQFTMDEIAELGLQKFDFLRIENLSILKRCCQLIEERHGEKISIYDIPDYDKEAYALISSGRLGGVFQLEASQTTRDWAAKMRPQSISETADLTSLVRPGPLQAGLTSQYLINKENGYPPEELHPLFAEVFKDTYWTLTYQEQILKLLANVAGFTLQEADDVRRAIGKKKTDKLIPARDAFIKGSIKNGVPQDYAEEFWDKTIIGFADYAFAKPHAVAYSYLTYICAYLKAHYPIEFFTALMDIRSQVLQPLDWSSKAPGYTQEAKQFGIQIKTPDINKSSSGFTINNKHIHFGLGSIRKVGGGSSHKITAARGDTSFKSVVDFLSRVDKSKINTGVFQSLVLSGCFDSLGYNRQELLDATDMLYDWFRVVKEAEERTATNAMREIENVHIAELITKRDEIRKRMKKKDYIPNDEDTQFLEEHPRIALHRMLAIPEVPPEPKLPRYRELSLSIRDLLTQGELIGCYLPHPAALAYPNTTAISLITQTGDYKIAGTVGEIKTYKNSRGTTTYLQVSDGTASLRVPIYSNNKLHIPKKGDLIHLRCYVVVTHSYDDDGNETQVMKVKSVSSLEVYSG